MLFLERSIAIQDLNLLSLGAWGHDTKSEPKESTIQDLQTKPLIYIDW
jgi:hypothetical protein